MGGVVPNKVMLRNCFKEVWSMEITETTDGLYFQNNWANFVEDNSITNGDCLVFFYDGYGLFDFVLFDQFGSEKIVVPTDAQPQVKTEVKEEEEDDDVVVVDDDDNNGGHDSGDEDDSNFVIEEDNNEDNVGDDSGDEDDSNFITKEDKNEAEKEEDDEEVKAWMLLGFTNSEQNRNNPGKLVPSKFFFLKISLCYMFLQ